MSSIVISGDTSGAITLAAPAVAGTNTATLPASTGTVMVSGNMPAFRAALSGNQTITNNTNTKLVLNTEVIDTNNCYDPTTNYRFTPNVAGYYQINSNVEFSGTAVRQYAYVVYIYKNGSNLAYSQSALSLANGSGGDNSVCVSALVLMNGTTDYLELYVYSYDFTTLASVNILAVGTSFNGVLVRTA
jgi:hypothetical protein